MSAMKTALKTWREDNGLTLREMAERIGIAGKNPATTYQRLETGQHQVSPLLVEAIVKQTGGAVSVQQLHEANVRYLKSRSGAPSQTSQDQR